MPKKKKVAMKEPVQEQLPKGTIVGTFAQERVLAEDKGPARELHDHSRFGESKERKMNYSLVEALYLLEKQKMNVYDGKNNLTEEQFIKKARKTEPNFWIRYCVFKDLRSRGYIVKTALKFGADFRVYDRGVKPGEDHARWIVFPVHEGGTLTWYDFAAKNRVAHSTRKRLLLAIVDEENSVTFYECRWLRP
jgi:tRNA-intron endonuclease, archaea type